jgi:hypothetical protein
MTTFAIALAAIALAAPAPKPPLDCAREIADARQLYEHQASERLRFAGPLASAVEQVIDRTLDEEDRALIRGFKRGTVSAADLDARLWPRLRRVFARFNGADCRHLGGVARAEELVDALTAMRGGPGLHTGVVVSCARRVPGLEARSHLGLRVRPDDDGPTLVLQGVVERPDDVTRAAGDRPEVRRVAVQIPLGDRAAELASLSRALAGYAGAEADFAWIVPAACGGAVALRLATP